MTALYQLVMHSGPTPGKVFPLDGDVITIGREAENGIVINDAEVSRKHTQFVFQGGKYIITDLGSTNGTFVNGERLTGQHVLVPGEVISLGEQINLLYEGVSQVDPNATVLSAGRAPAPAISRPVTPAPMSRPASTPLPPPAYAGQMPAGPAPLPASGAPAKSGNSRIGLIVAIVIVLCLLCACAGSIWYIDANSLWCKFLPFLFPNGCVGG